MEMLNYSNSLVSVQNDNEYRNIVKIKYAPYR